MPAIVGAEAGEITFKHHAESLKAGRARSVCYGRGGE